MSMLGQSGELLWTTPLAVGAWVEGALAAINGGADSWSGGALDEETGIAYMPVGNAAPDFSSATRPGLHFLPVRYATLC